MRSIVPTETLGREAEVNVELSTRCSMRRSSRVQVRIPVSVTGTLPDGRTFTEDTYVLTVSKYGARLQCSNPLRPGTKISAKPKVGSSEALFHVVWVGGRSGNTGEVGIQYVPRSNLFGVSFPE
jgi:hypothetical protein